MAVELKKENSDLVAMELDKKKNRNVVAVELKGKQ